MGNQFCTELCPEMKVNFNDCRDIHDVKELLQYQLDRVMRFTSTLDQAEHVYRIKCTEIEMREMRYYLSLYSFLIKINMIIDSQTIPEYKGKDIMAKEKRKYFARQESKYSLADLREDGYDSTDDESSDQPTSTASQKTGKYNKKCCFTSEEVASTFSTLYIQRTKTFLNEVFKTEASCEIEKLAELEKNKSILIINCN
jgi:hypothetical protein